MTATKFPRDEQGIAEMMRVMDECAAWAPTDYRKRETAKAFLRVGAYRVRARIAEQVSPMLHQLADALMRHLPEAGTRPDDDCAPLIQLAIDAHQLANVLSSGAGADA